MYKRHSFRSLWRYFHHRMVAERGDVDYIARGWALGMFVGCLIPVGLQLVVAIPLSFLFRGSKIGAAVGTCLTNPVTIWFIYPAQCWLGERLLGGQHAFGTLRELLHDLLHDHNPAALKALSGELLSAFFLGGLMLAIVLTPLTYYAVRVSVLRYRKLREKLHQRRMTRLG